MTVYALDKQPSEKVALTMMGGGVTAFLLWREMGLSHVAYEVMPAILVGLAIFFVLPKQQNGETAGESAAEAAKNRP
jgi:Na+/pantothenate symporter